MTSRSRRSDRHKPHVPIEIPLRREPSFIPAHLERNETGARDWTFTLGPDSQDLDQVTSEVTDGPEHLPRSASDVTSQDERESAIEVSAQSFRSREREREGERGRGGEPRGGKRGRAHAPHICCSSCRSDVVPCASFRCPFRLWVRFCSVITGTQFLFSARGGVVAAHWLVLRLRWPSDAAWVVSRSFVGAEIGRRFRTCDSEVPILILSVGFEFVCV